MIPKFTLSMNTAAMPGRVYVHHNKNPKCAGIVIVFRSHQEALQWAKEKELAGLESVYAIRGQFGIEITDPKELLMLPVPVEKHVALVKRMLDWYAYNGISDDPNTESYPRPKPDEFQQ